jgi:hypothetical protein
MSASLHVAASQTATDAATSNLGATYKVDGVWATTFQAIVTLVNNSSSSTTSWTATFIMPTGYTLSSHTSSGVFTVSGQTVTVKNLSGKGVIQPKASTTFSMMINMPRSSPTIINNLQAVANGTVTPPTPTAPVAPVLNYVSGNSIEYAVSWNSVANATSYVLYQDTNINFANQQIVATGNVFSKTFTNQPDGTYYYRVLAKNTVGNSPYSNTQTFTVTEDNNPQPPVQAGIEHSAWYIDWTSWFNGPPFVIPTDVNLLNLFVGKLSFGADGKPTVDGFGTMTSSQIKAFTAYCAAQVPPISVKASIGGGGGSYDRCWDLLTAQNVKTFALGLADFCHSHNVVGIDFDYEAFGSEDQEVLVGTLIKEFKAIDSNLQTSFCTNAGFGPNFPWQAVVKTVFDAATIAPGNCAVDRLYVMSYYDPIESEKTWVTGWANWVIQNYGFTPTRVSVGIDDFDAHAYDPVVFKAWAASQGYSTAHWAFDPARP